ncbi:MAG: hypothetical protein Kow002_12460 [Anaerolineales bacterium]
MSEQKTNTSWLSKSIHPALPGITNEIVLFALVILLALITRFYDLESRVMSHDESLHTYFSWLLYRGQGYQHNPMMHGPLQFHLLALTYFLFGVTDFTARIPSVIFSLATVWMVWYWRRYLGKTGALIAAFLMVISPYMLYYGRYVRNETFAGLSGILMLYAILRYLEVGQKRYLYMIALALVIHFTAKETAFIYAAQALLFLAVYFVAQVTRRPWEGRLTHYRAFIIFLSLGLLLIGGALGYSLYTHGDNTLTGAETAAPANPDMPATPQVGPAGGANAVTILAIAGLLALIGAAFYLISGYGWEKVRANRSFGLLILIGTIVLPMLAPFPIKFMESWLRVSIPTTAGEVAGMYAATEQLLGLPRDVVVIGAMVALLFALSIIIGQLWNREWWQPALLYWGIFIVLYTTVFTNSSGFFTGLTGSLGYWLVQQGVERGSQPWYYYIAIQVPIYEFLPALGTLLAVYLGFKKLNAGKPHPTSSADSGAASSSEVETASVSETPALPGVNTVDLNFANTFGLLVWWTVSSTIAFSYAGERMPWLTYHIAWPMILLTGWGLAALIKKVDWEAIKPARMILTLLVATLFVITLFQSIGTLTGPTPPFQGKDLASLEATNAFLLPAIAALACIFALFYLMEQDLIGLVSVALFGIFLMGLFGIFITAISIPTGPLAETGPVTSSIIRLSVAALITIGSLIGLIFARKSGQRSFFPAIVTLVFFALLTVLTVRASFRAAYINYDSAKEYLVYAHGAPGIKQVMAQAREISNRTTGGMELALAYDASAPDTGVSWPFVWYLRDYTNQRSFDQPTKSLRESVFIVVDAKNFDKIEPALGPGYYRYDYIRMWWPNQDYFGLTKERIAHAFTNTAIRKGMWDIWFNRDYTSYAQATGKTDLTPTTWQPADAMRLYIRKDIVAQIWEYGAPPAETVQIEDPTEGKEQTLLPDLVLDASLPEPVLLNAPRALAFAPDGTFYVADSRNHRILHYNVEGQLLHQWGAYGDITLDPELEMGLFNEPWGVAVGPDGSVYVSDTWNHRIQKFTPEGQPLNTWGHYGQAEDQYGFWGPRGLAVDAEGYLYVADTGNKRIVIYDADGVYKSEFGTAGLAPGQFDEPTGVTVGADGKIYVADTWNQRIQVFSPIPDKTYFVPEKQWDFYGWYGQSLDNKPFIAVNQDGHIFITDPEQYRVVEFTPDGEVVRTWGNFDVQVFGLPSGIAVDAEGHIWVTDAVNNSILRFTLP